MQKAAGIEIARAGGIDQTRDFLSRDFDGLSCGNDDRPVLAARQRRNFALPAHRTDGLVEIAGLKERANLRLIGEQDVDVTGDELAKFGAVAVYAKRIGERQADFAAG